MSARHPYDNEQLELLRVRSGVFAGRDAQDLLSWRFFSLAKVRRATPTDFRVGMAKRARGRIAAVLPVAEGAQS